MITVIAEKHDIAKAISEALGMGAVKKGEGCYIVNDYCITYCVGHLLNVVIPNENEVWKWDNLPIEINDWSFTIKDDTKKQYSVISSLIHKSDSIIHAGDPDDEGQLIVDEILYKEGIIDLKGKTTKEIKRLLINDINPNVIQKEFKKLKDNNDYLGLSLKALSRKLADITFGYNLTRAFTLKNQELGNQGVVSVGRVQTPMLALITRRDSEVKNHLKSYYYDITANLTITEQNSLIFKYKAKQDEIDDKGYIVSEATATNIVERVKQNFSKGIIQDYKIEDEEKTPPLPYNLLALQVDCSKFFKLKPDKVLEITQTLREKYKAITYNRSDCQYLNDDTFDDAPKLLNTLKLTAEQAKNNDLLQILNKTNTSLKSKAFNSKKTSAHTAIIPTDVNLPLLALTKDEQNVYILIAKQFVLQFLPNAIYKKHTITLTFADDEFIHSSSECVSLGWKELYKEDEDDKINVSKKDFSFLQDLKGKTFNENKNSNVGFQKKETQPKKLYTTATFLTDLKRVADYCKNEKIKKLLKDKDKNIAGEHGGIGTPATRSSIIKTLYTRGYLLDDPKGNVISTKLGQNLIASLPENITYPDMTALWHEELVDVEAKTKSVNDFVQSVFIFTQNEVESVKAKKINFDSNATKCSKCDGHLVKKKGSNGFFWGCSNYPNCKATYPDKNCKPDLTEKSVASEKFRCLACNSKLIKRQGQYGFFWACSNYPTCKTTYPDKKGEPIYQKK